MGEVCTADVAAASFILIVRSLMKIYLTGPDVRRVAAVKPLGGGLVDADG
jgi:hypothetical protein